MVMEVGGLHVLLVRFVNFLRLVRQLFASHLCKGKLGLSIAFSNSAMAIVLKTRDYGRLDRVGRPFILVVADSAVSSVDLIRHMGCQHHCWVVSVACSIWSWQ